MLISREMSFEDLKKNSWCGAIDTIKKVREARKEDELMEFLEDIFIDDGILSNRNADLSGADLRGVSMPFITGYLSNPDSVTEISDCAVSMPFITGYLSNRNADLNGNAYYQKFYLKDGSELSV